MGAARDDATQPDNATVLAELRLMREQLMTLVAEIRNARRKGAKRARTIAQREAANVRSVADGGPTELQMALARKRLRRRP